MSIGFLKEEPRKWRSLLKIMVACFAGRSQVPWAESAGDVADYGSLVMEEVSHFECAGAGVLPGCLERPGFIESGAILIS